MVYVICLLVGIFVFVAYDAIYDLVMGNTGRKGQIVSHFEALRGRKEKENNGQNKLWRKGVDGSANLKKQYLFVLPLCLLIFAISFLAFKSAILAFIISLFGLLYPKVKSANEAKKRKEILQNQLRDALNSIMSSLKAGLSINSALIKCADDLEKIYISTKDKPMLYEFKRIRNDLGMGISVDDALKNFRDRIDMEDVHDFVNSILTIRQKGGNLVEVMDNVTKMITDKIAIKKEIDILTSGKKMEAKVLTMIPIFVIVSLSLFSPKYMEPLYGSLVGKVLIVLGLCLLALNYFIGRKITDINV